MTKLKLINRPTVVFDPANKEHRRMYAEFIQNKSWGKCPVKFELPDDDGNNLAYAMQRKLTAYLLGREFKMNISEDFI